MEYFRKIRDYVLGEDLSSDTDSPPASRPAKRTAGRHADTHQQTDPRAKQQQQQQQQAQTQHAAPARGEAVPSTAALPRGPGVLRDVTDGKSGGVQGLSWYKARLKQDADGDVAEQFWSEVASQPTGGGTLTEQPKRPLKVQRKQLSRPQTGDIRVKEGNVDVEIRQQ